MNFIRVVKDQPIIEKLFIADTQQLKKKWRDWSSTLPGRGSIQQCDIHQSKICEGYAQEVSTWRL